MDCLGEVVCSSLKENARRRLSRMGLCCSCFLRRRRSPSNVTVHRVVASGGDLGQLTLSILTSKAPAAMYMPRILRRLVVRTRTCLLAAFSSPGMIHDRRRTRAVKMRTRRRMRQDNQVLEGLEMRRSLKMPWKE